MNKINDTAYRGICNYFSEGEVNSMARETGFVQRKSAITGFNYLVTFTLGLLHQNESTLTQMSSFFEEIFSVTVSPQAIDGRINKRSAKFLELSLNKLLKRIEVPAPLKSLFNHIYIHDSTHFELHPDLKKKYLGMNGNASPAAMKIHYCYDFMNTNMSIKLSSWRKADIDIFSENIEGLLAKKNSLFLQDLGFYKLTHFSAIAKSGNYFVSKIKFNSKFNNKTGEKIDIQKLIKNGEDEIKISVDLNGQKAWLIGHKLPPEVMRKKIRKAKINNKQRTLSKEYLSFLSYNFYLTNLPEEYITYEIIYSLYRIRWQIELIFRTWKSLLKIGKINSAKEGRVHSEIYGKLIVAILLSKLYAGIGGGVKYSYYKVVQYCKCVSVIWAKAISAGILSHYQFVTDLKRKIKRLCKKTRQKDKPIIEDLLLKLPMFQNLTARKRKLCLA